MMINVSLPEFFSILFLSSFIGFCGVVLMCLIIAKTRAWWARRHRIRCRICGYRFFYRRPNGEKSGICPNCGAKNR